jgi:SAM-dependent methyltransferase
MTGKERNYAMSVNTEMEAFFDRLAPTWTDNADEYEVREKIVERMNLPADCVIADIGCGKGVMFEHLLKTNPRSIVGVDLSGEMLRHAQELYQGDARLSFIKADVLTVDLPELDAAVIFNSYPHFLDKKALAEKLAAHIRKGGSVIIAHSVSRSRINERHKGGMATVLSAPLEAAEKEAAHFVPFFIADMLIDDDDGYFIKLRRVE